MAKASTPLTLPLWPDGAPHARGREPHDQPWIDLYRPENPNGCAVLICPGGGYGGLADDHEGRQVALMLGAAGVTAAVLHYRLGSKGYRHPVMLGDAQRGLRLLRSRAAADSTDPLRTGAMGFSAGGHLTATLGTHFAENAFPPVDEVDKLDARPAFLILGYPVISFDPAITHRGSVNNLLGDKATDTALVRSLSCETRVTDQTPPVFLFHTGDDAAVPVENSLRFYEALRSHHVPVEMHLYRSGPHGVGLMQGDPVLGTWGGHATDWLRESGFLAGKYERGAVSGQVMVNGRPATWATLCFLPQDPGLPIVTAKVRNGKYALGPKDGPPAGPCRVRATLSGADVPAADAPAGVFEMTQSSRAGGVALQANILPGQNQVDFSLIWE